MRIFVLPSFSDDVFLSFYVFCPLPNPLPQGEGMMVLKTDQYQTFCNLSPLPVGEG